MLVLAASMKLEQFMYECNISFNVNDTSSMKNVSKEIEKIFRENSILEEGDSFPLDYLQIQEILHNKKEFSQDFEEMLNKTSQFNKIKTMIDLLNSLIISGFSDNKNEGIYKNRNSFQQFFGANIFNDDIFSSAIDSLMKDKFIQEYNNSYEITIRGIQFYYLYQYTLSTPTYDKIYSKNNDDINKCNILMLQRNTIVQEKISTLNLFHSYINEKTQKKQFEISTMIQNNMVYATVSTCLVGLLGAFTTLYTQKIIDTIYWLIFGITIISAILIIFMIMSYNEQLTRLPNIKNRK